ncbi:MAG: sigma-70 family RNA polymerase sigma factor [Acidimicrobiia bacterium]|nr:sigma-70 family RNA polymerase sigma factor [Acidimicrobiia bacterium]
MNSEVEEAHRRHWPSVLAATVRLTRDLDLAEECAQEAFVRAIRVWGNEVPRNEVAWLTTVAMRIALDRMRREATLRRKLPMLVVEEEHSGEDSADLLRLIFMCCHPSLSEDAQLAMTLRLVCGLTTPEVASVLLVKESTAAARITRAKRKIATSAIPFRLPSEDDLPARLETVVTIVHLIYTAGHTASGTDLTRIDLISSALQLSRTLYQTMPEEPEVKGLLALVLLGKARNAARLGDDGELRLLSDQDRTKWDRRLLSKGIHLATEALRDANIKGGPGRVVLQAAIAGLHSVAPSWEATDWTQVVTMYDGLMQRWPSPVVALNRCAASSLVPGVDLEEVLTSLDDLSSDPMLEGYVYLPATRADILSRLGRTEEARVAYREALELARNDRERRFLRRRQG